jgi:hypothetical protein
MSQKSLFNFNDNFSWSNHDCNCNGTFLESELNGNVVMLPPSTVLNGFEVVLPVTTYGSEYNAAQPVVGVVHKPSAEHAPITLGKSENNSSSVQLLNALGSLSQKDLEGSPIMPSNESLHVNSVVNNVVKEVESKMEVAKEVKKEQVNSEIVKTVKEVVQSVVKDELNRNAHPESEKVSMAVSNSASASVEAALKPAQSLSLSEVEAVTKQNVSTVLKQSGMSEQESNKHAETVANAVVTKVMTSNVATSSELPVLPEVVNIVSEKSVSESNKVLSTPAVVSAMNETSKQISDEMNNNARPEVVHTILNENLVKPLSENLHDVVQKSVTTTENNGILVTVEINKEHLEKKLTEHMTNLIQRNCKEHFSPFNTTNLLSSLQVSVNNAINKAKTLNKNKEHMETSTESSVIKGTAEVSSSSQPNSNIVTVETLTSSNLNKSEIAEAVAEAVAKQLTSVNVSNVAVLTKPNNNNNNMVVSVEVPKEVNPEQVSQLIVGTVDRHSRSSNKSSKSDLFGSNMLVNMLVVGLIGYFIYKLYNSH